MMKRLNNLARRAEIDSDIAAELQSHIALRIDENIAAGMSPAEARREALLRFGNPTLIKERVAAVDTTLSLDGLARDFHYAARKLRRSPGFALTAILTLVLGIGANVVVFGVLNALILRPLNLPGAERLFEVEQLQQGDTNQSYPDFLDFRGRNTSFSDMAAYRLALAGLSTGGVARKAWQYEVSGNYFDMLGVQPQLGRFFHASDEHGPNSAPYIVLSDALWRTRFNANPNVVGMTVDLNKHSFTIIGVAPKSFNGTELFFWPDFWMPMINGEQIEGYSFLSKRGNHGLFIIGMLKPGVTLQQATNNLTTIAHQLAHEYPATNDGMGARLVKPGLLGDTLGGPARPFLAVIMLLALLVLAAAGTNLAGIFAARAADRSRELAIRLSIGSTRWRILRQLLTEAVLISTAGGLVGTLLASTLLGILSRWQPIAQFPIHVTVVPDARVFFIALLLTFASGILPGLLTARQVWQTDAMQAMKGVAPGSGLLRRLSLRDVLLAIQITLCALLVTASLVALRGMMHSLSAPFGFVPNGAILAEADMRMAGYSDKDALPVQRRMIDQASRIPGVTAVGTVDDTPLSASVSTASVYREGNTDLRPSMSVMEAHRLAISPGYLQAAGTHLLAGRAFTWDDGPTSPKIALVNQNFARRIFGSAPAVGRRFLLGDKTSYEIVGIVEDGKYDSLTEEPTAAMFFPLAQNNEAYTTLVVRSQLPAAEVIPALNRMLTGIDSSLPFTLRPWPDSLALVLFPARVASAALGVMGLLAAMLAITGVFGMAAYSVSKRLRELGIRVALGARRSQLIRAALARPVILLLSGSAAGLLLGVLASRLLTFLVYEATPRDPLVLLGAVLAMTLIGLVATWIPARRALAVNPAQLLRED
ncbi:MAG TPA: ABC transporter permease [Terracidiphilus sp.]|jgi:predicted permease|nr:ABC transporter permease [Terracidiphilus sp.]